MKEDPHKTNPAQQEHKVLPEQALPSSTWQSGTTVDHELFLQLLRLAKGGSADALGQLVESNQSYLLLIANQEVDGYLQAKVGASDVVQETLAAAHQNIDKFQGHSPEELRGWLRAILKNQILAYTRQYSSAKRDVNREGPVSNAAPVRDLHPTPRTTAAYEK